MNSNRLFAVITGDVVDSSKTRDEHRARLNDALKASFEAATRLFSGKNEGAVSFDIFRGDSFQGVLYNPADALAASLVIRASLRKFQPAGSSTSWDARTAIGIGTIGYLPDTVTEGDGEAYRRSGPMLDEMKSGERLLIATPWEQADAEFAPPAALLDAVIAKWTSQHAETVLELLAGRSRKAIGRIFDISQAAVHYRIKGAGWFAIEKFLQRFRSVIREKSGQTVKDF
ncbi:MAG: hypothetical protein R3224_04875 [Balneolaceae bacterium]|nr:hypothetical protein [Balneolaceae bacterium]